MQALFVAAIAAPAESKKTIPINADNLKNFILFLLEILILQRLQGEKCFGDHAPFSLLITPK
jgi:hypothetical protein